VPFFLSKAIVGATIIVIVSSFLVLITIVLDLFSLSVAESLKSVLYYI